MEPTITQFRTDFPEFSNPSTFPDGQIQFYLDMGVLLLRPKIWKSMYSRGIELFTAHHMSLAASAQAAAASGGIPGATTGTVASKAVDKVSISYNASQIVSEGAGYWNLTIYGLQFWNLVRMFGAGGAYISGGTPLIPAGQFPIWSNPLPV